MLLAKPRGTDSTGIATPTELLKKAEDADKFISRKLPTAKTVIGHTRAKTTGKVSDRNAHPFMDGEIVGVHNGWISSFYKLKNSENRQEMQVDSEIIWHLINEYGLEGAIPKMSGTYALAWIDEEDQLNLYRHSSPTSIGFKDGGLYFASMPKYLNVIGCEDIEELEEHYHLVINDGKILETNDLTDIKPKRTTTSRNSDYYNTGQNTYPYGDRRDRRQTKKSSDESLRQKYTPQFAPDDADYVNSEEGHVVYFWWPDTTYTKLCVEPIYRGVDYEWKETYNLEKEDQQRDLHKQFESVYNLDEIQSIIENLNEK